MTNYTAHSDSLMELSIELNKDLFTNRVALRATREGFGDGLLQAGHDNENIVALTADLKESTHTHKFAKEFPKRFFEIGIAEQNMIGIAAGLALSGKIPFATSFAEFVPGRSWEQIRLTVAYSNTNVKLIGSHAGLSNGGDGATHQALEDIATTRVLPNLTVISPCDFLETYKATLAIAKFKGPIYMRLCREKTPEITTHETPFKIGQANVLLQGNNITIAATGPVIYEALLAAKELKLKHGINCEIINFSTIKPLDTKTLLHSVKKTKLVVTLEEHQIDGGLGSAISEYLSEHFPCKIKRIGVNNTFTESGTYQDLKEKYGLTKEHILMEIKQLLTKN